MTERKKIGITREGLEQLQPYGEGDGDGGGGEVMEILMEHATVDTDAGLLWDAKDAYDSSQLVPFRTKYVVAYGVGEDGGPGVLGVREPIHEDEVESEQIYDLYLTDE